MSECQPPVRSIRAGKVCIGPEAKALVVIAGPCVAESLDLCLQVGAVAKATCERLGVQYVFKASFDKANRTSLSSYRGPGLRAGLEILQAVRTTLDVPVCTDIHESDQAGPVAEVADMVQIPAFLCRQTDLLTAAARSGRCINVKKGQFMAPWDMRHVIGKIVSQGNENLLLTERGVSFGYNTLVVDLTSLPIMRSLGYPVCMDATHAVQRPAAADGQSGGNRQFVPHLARAAAAVGIDALFLEIHPDPPSALSDSASMLPLAELERLLREVVAIDRLIRAGADAGPMASGGELLLPTT